MTSLWLLFGEHRAVLNDGRLGVLVLLTVVIGGGAAYLNGVSLAREWRPVANVFLGMIALAAGIRFLHFALYQEPLLSFSQFLITYVFLTIVALLGYRLKRVEQMVTQYPWLYQKAGPMAWKSKQ